MRKIRRNRNKKSIVLVRKIRNLFDTALYMKQWQYVNILDSQTEVASVRDYLDFVGKVLHDGAIQHIARTGNEYIVYVKPLPFVRTPIALRNEDADLFYGVQIARPRMVSGRMYDENEIVYLNISERGAKFIVCHGCGRPIVGDEWIETSDTNHIYCMDCEDCHYYRCESCNEYFDEAIITASNDSDRHICEGCYENGADDWFFCDECEEYCAGESYSVYNRDGNEVYVCEDCLDRYYRVCNDCDNYVHESCGTWVSADTFICDACLDNDWARCYRCDEWYRRDEMHEDDDGDYICDNCWDRDDDDDSYNDDEGIRGYHDDRGGSWSDDSVGDYGMEYLLVESRTDNPMLGVELEIDEGGHNHDKARKIRRAIGWDYIICSSDSSLNHGFELVSCPADLQSHMEKIDWCSGMNTALNLGYKSHDAGTCGLHTHIDREFFEGADPSDVDARFTVSFQNNLWWLKRFSRRDDRGGSWCYCNPNSSRYLNDEDKLDKAVVKNKAFVEAIKGCSGHGIALNFGHSNTIEIRFYRGTLKYNSFLAALQCSDIWARLIKSCTVDDAVELTLTDFIREATQRGYTAFLTYLQERDINMAHEPKRKRVVLAQDDDCHYIQSDGRW